MQATARRLSVVYTKSSPRRRLIRDVVQKMKKTIDLLIAVGAKLNAPASEYLIGSIESQYQIRIPPGARELYKEANGADGEFGNWIWLFWAIDSEEIRLSDYFKRPREYKVEDRIIDPHKYLRFFDALIDAPLYAYCADPESKHFGEVLGIHSDNGEFDAFISAPSVELFLSLLVQSKTDDAILMNENGA
jgi:hypothetical protein